MLSELAAAMATKLLNETTYAQERLQNSPNNVTDLVEYSQFFYKTNDSQKEYSEFLDKTIESQKVYSERGVDILSTYKQLND